MIQKFTLKQTKFYDKRRGFSFLELLISISLLGLVMILIYGSFSQISNLSLGVKSNLNSREQLRLLMKIVLDDLQKIKYLKYFAQTGEKTNPYRETGLIAERIVGSDNSGNGNLIEFSKISFHSRIRSRFYPEKKDIDPEIHEVGYFLEEDPNSKTWFFKRREDFYIDNNLRDGGKIQILSRIVTKFDLEVLESETAMAGGGFIEKWTKEWNSQEEKCSNIMLEENFCLPRAIKLTMAVKGNDDSVISDTQIVNLCITPCDQEIFN